MITYEYPLVERIRTMLRLEDLFERARFYLERTEAPEHHAALLTLFEILDVTGRADLKSDLLQELERQKQVMYSFRSSPEIDQQVLASVVRDIEQTHAGLYNMVGKIGQHLRDNEWLMAIKQRTGIPGGACEFDLPSYHFWLHRESDVRLADLKGWVAPMLPIRDGAGLVLQAAARERQARAAHRAAGHVPADAGRAHRADGPHPARAQRRLRARDQRQPLRAERPLRRGRRHRAAAAHGRARRRFRADVLQPVTAAVTFTS